jgi:outer membrane protein assembly factor BamD (BamD/ComL family)
MKNFLYLICLLTLGILSCKKDSSYDKKHIGELESAFKSNPTDSTYDKLITAYLEVMQEHKDQPDIIEEILVKCIDASTQKQNCRQSVIFINNLIKNHFGRKDTPDNIVKMIDCLRTIGKAEAADILTLCFAQAFPNDNRKVQLMGNLKTQDSPENYLVNLAQSIFPDTVNSYDKEKAFNYVDACEAYALVLPNSDKSAEFLFSAAQTSKLLQTFDKCISLFDWIIEKYPNHTKAESAAFMKGFLFDNDLKDTAMAHKYYAEFIQKYPKSEFVDDAQMLIKNLGKSEEEILKELQSKNQQ